MTRSPRKKTRTATIRQRRVHGHVGSRPLFLSRFSSRSLSFRVLQGWLASGVAFTLLSCVVVAQEAGTRSATPSHHELAHHELAHHELAPYAVIFCTVWDPDSHPVYGVHVQLRRAGEKKFRWEAYSDHRGELAFRVPPGKADYELAADRKSLKALKGKDLTNREPVKVHVEYDEQVDTGLHLTK